LIGARIFNNKENTVNLFTEKEMEEMKQDRIALASASVFF
jgi:hypothetical protein